ncbi:unnamed protein product [Dicrocoelium dendriticum]|nr:unnamed protein product [Dicrocoelium dendriticum]
MARKCGHNSQSSFTRPLRNTRHNIQFTPSNLGESLVVPFIHHRNHHSQPLIRVSINGISILALIDTGATCTLVQPKFCLGLRRSNVNTRLLTANGSELVAEGRVMAAMVLGNRTVHHSVVLSSHIPWDAIFGIDLLRKMKCHLNMATNQLWIGECKLRMWEHNTYDSDGPTAACVTIDDQVRTLLTPVEGIIPSTAFRRLHQLIRSKEAAFAWEGSLPGRTNTICHQIDTGTAEPITQRPRRVPTQYREELRKMIEDMLDAKIIIPSKSPWSSPIVLVKKKNGSLRLCIDYRKLNDVTRKDSFPLPRIDDTLEALSGAQWFSTLDLASGYWQVEIDPKDREKTAFIIPSGLYEFQTMPFGLTNAPATFQRLMQIVLRTLIPNQCLVYLDDVIVHGRSLEEHLDNLGLVLQHLHDAGLKLKPQKCQLLKRQVTFLGHIITPSGIQSDPSKVETIQGWPVPTSAEDVRQFLGLASYYRRFIRNFADIAGPLHRLTEKGRTFNWTPQCAKAFEFLRRALTNSPILSFPDLSPSAGQFILDTDASDTGIGAVLSQVGSDGLEHVIAYGSRCLSKPERNYCVTRKELLALVVYTKHFRHLLLGQRFVVRTDHQALKWLQSFRDPEGQVARWQELLQEYNFECVHRPGRQHCNADALSRRGGKHHINCPSCSQHRIDIVSLDNSDSTEWATLQKDDPELKLIYHRLVTDGIKPSRAEMAGFSWEAHCIWSAWSRLTIHDEILYYQYGSGYVKRIVVPQSRVNAVLKELHAELGHPGQRKMEEAVSQRFWWPDQRRDIVNFCNSCQECLRAKPPQQPHRAPLQPIATGYPNQIVAVDIVGPLPETPRGNRFVLVMVDHFTKWCEAVPLSCTNATMVARNIFEQWITRWGAPEQLHSDRGSNFESIIVSEMCHLLNIRKTRTTAYHPQGNGAVERANRSLKALLKAFTDENGSREWDIALPHCLLAYRATIHSSTGHSPHLLVTGREMRLPFDLTLPRLATDPLLATEYATNLRNDLLRAHQLARDSLANAQKHQKDYYDLRVHGHPVQPGQLVYLHCPTPPVGTSAKLHKVWHGPIVVDEVYDDLTCRVTDRGRSFVVHFNRLKPATMSHQGEARPNEAEAPVPAATECVEITTSPSVIETQTVECVAGDANFLGE